MGTEKSPSGTRRCGFTLIELLVVMAIVAILSLLVLPSYLDVVVRNQVIEALPLAEVAQKPVAESWALTQEFPADNTAANLPLPEKVVSNLVSSIVIEWGAIHLTFGNRANGLLRGKILTLRPAIVIDAPVVPVAWVCGFAPVPGKMTVEGENKTSVPARYLPQKCRGA